MLPTAILFAFIVTSSHVVSQKSEMTTELYYTGPGISKYRCKEGISSSMDVGISTPFENGISSTSSMCYTRVYSYGSRSIDGEDVQVDNYFIEKGFVDQKFRDAHGDCENVAETNCALKDDASVICCCLTKGSNACNDGFENVAVKKLIESRFRTVDDELYECPSKNGGEVCETPGCFSLRSDQMDLLASGCWNPRHAAYSSGMSKGAELTNENSRRLCKKYKQRNGCSIVYTENKVLVNLCCCELPSTCEEFFLADGRTIRTIDSLLHSQ